MHDMENETDVDEEYPDQELGRPEINLKGEGDKLKLKDEVAELFSMIKQYRASRDWRYFNSEERVTNRRTSYLFVLALMVCAGIYVLVKYVPPSFWLSINNPMAIFQGLLLLAYAVTILFAISTALEMKSYFKDAVGSLLDILGPTVQSEIELFEELDKYSTTSIAYVAERLMFVNEQLSFIKSSAVGVVEKIGIIPGIIATAIAFNQALENIDGLPVQILSFFIAGIYIAIYPVLFSSMRFKQYGLLLEQYLKLERGVEVQ